LVDIELGNAATHEEGLAFVARSANSSARRCALLVLSDKILLPQRHLWPPADANAISWIEAEWKAAAAAVGQVIERCKSFGLRWRFIITQAAT